MSYKAQLFLEKYPLRQNKKFLKLLYSTDELRDADKWFDFRDNKIERQNDSLMTLEKFLKLISQEALIRLQIGSPEKDKIRYCIRLPDEGKSRFVWIQCPYTGYNFDFISKLYQKAFNKMLEDEF
jgi:hypothetical protein